MNKRTETFAIAHPTLVDAGHHLDLVRERGRGGLNHTVERLLVAANDTRQLILEHLHSQAECGQPLGR